MYSYPKKNRDKAERASRPKKRKFHSNKYTNNEENEDHISSSAKKLCKANFNDITFKPFHSYKIIEFSIVFSALQNIFYYVQIVKEK